MTHFATRRVYHSLVVVCHFISFFFSVQEKCYKVGVIVFIGVLRNMKVKCDLLRRKKLFFFVQEVTLHFFFDASHRYVSCLYGLVSRLNRKCSADITKTLNTCSLFRVFFTLRFYPYPFKKFLCYSTQLDNKVFSFQKSYNNQQVHGLMNLLSKFCLISINFLWIG